LIFVEAMMPHPGRDLLSFELSSMIHLVKKFPSLNSSLNLKARLSFDPRRLKRRVQTLQDLVIVNQAVSWSLNQLILR